MAAEKFTYPARGSHKPNVRVLKPDDAASDTEAAPPNDLEAEKAILTICLNYPDKVAELRPLLFSSQFYSERHATIYKALVSLDAHDLGSDLIMVRSALKKRGLFGENEGQVSDAELMTIAKDFKSPVHLRHYAKLIVQQWAYRQSYQLSLDIAAAALNRTMINVVARQQWIDEALQRFDPKTLQDQLISASELVKQDFAPVKWIVPDILPEGLSMLSAKPKIGKSWLALLIALAVAAGGVALDKKLEGGEVLYLALEDNPRRLKNRIQKLCLDGIVPKGLELATKWHRAHQGGVEAIEGWLKKHSTARLVIVDTLAKFRKPQNNKNGMLYEEDYSALEGLKNLSDTYRVSILVIHHNRKGQSDDVLEDVSGSTGLTAGLDNLLTIRRSRGAADAVLSVIGRDIEGDQELALEFDKATAYWKLLGDASEHEVSEARRDVIELLKSEQGGMTASTLTRELGKPGSSVRRLLRDMVNDGQIIQEGERGRYRIKSENKRTSRTSEQPEHREQANIEEDYALNDDGSTGVEGSTFGCSPRSDVRVVRDVRPNAQNYDKAADIRATKNLLSGCTEQEGIERIVASIQRSSDLNEDERTALLNFARSTSEALALQTQTRENNPATRPAVDYDSFFTLIEKSGNTENYQALIELSSKVTSSIWLTPTEKAKLNHEITGAKALLTGM